MTHAALEAELDELLGAAVDAGRVPCAVGIVGARGETVYENAFGTGDGGLPLRVDTIFRIASMTKLATTVAGLQLVERGLLELDTPVAELLPAFGELMVLEGFADYTPRLRAQRGSATVRQLFTHTAGLGYDTWNAALGRYHSDRGIPIIGSGRRDAFRAPLIADPGTRFEYSTGCDWLGLVIEEITGMPLDAYFRENIFDRLRTRDMTAALTAEQRARLVPVCERLADGSFSATGMDLAQDPEFFAGGHCLYSTATDFLELQQALLNGGMAPGGRLLAPGSARSMFTNQIGGLRVGVIHTALLQASVDVDVGPDRRWGWGGLLNECPVPAGRGAWSAAWAGLFNTFYWIDPGARIAGGLYFQYLPFWDREATELLEQFERVVYAHV